MFDLFLAQILIVSFTLMCELRMFFTKDTKVDYLAFFAPISFLTSGLVFYIWGAEFANIILVLFTFAVLITNVRSLLRLTSRLFVDYYSGPFKVFNFLEVLASIFLMVMLVIYHPVKIVPQDYGVTKTSTEFSGSLKDGFSENSDYLNFSHDGVLFNYRSADPVESNFEYKPVFLYVGAFCGPVVNYEPLFLLMAQKGYEVYAADIFSDDFVIFGDYRDSRVFRKNVMQRKLFEENSGEEDVSFEAARNSESALLTEAYSRMMEFMISKLGDESRIYLICDGIDLSQVKEKFPRNVMGWTSISSISDYSTSPFGFIETTQVYYARRFQLDRDSSFFIPRYVCNKLLAQIEKNLPVKQIEVPEEPVSNGEENNDAE